MYSFYHKNQDSRFKDFSQRCYVPKALVGNSKFECFQCPRDIELSLVQRFNYACAILSLTQAQISCRQRNGNVVLCNTEETSMIPNSRSPSLGSTNKMFPDVVSSNLYSRGTNLCSGSGNLLSLGHFLLCFDFSL